jgi:hypothetical protein
MLEPNTAAAERVRAARKQHSTGCSVNARRFDEIVDSRGCLVIGEWGRPQLFFAAGKYSLSRGTL